jgi:hypothetical protein
MILLTAMWLLAHAWYPSQCCSDHDCHPVPCDEIHSDGDFYNYRGIRWFKAEAAPSPDGDCHVCYNSKTRWGRCLFLGGVS